MSQICCLSEDAIQVLACLPCEPAAAVVAEIAHDVFLQGAAVEHRRTRHARGRVRRALKEIRRHVRLYRDYRPYDTQGRPVPWGRRERYGVARAHWRNAQQLARQAS